ncbi:MAG: DUF1826 domain-containing protein [Myxococcota bacterium]
MQSDGAMNRPFATDAGCHRPFADILRPNVNILSVRRPFDRSVARIVAGVARGRAFELSARIDVGQPDPSPLLEHVADPRARRLLARDIVWLVGEFGALLGKKHLHAELSVVRADGCRKFHADNVTIRLLCTYVGPGTEWIADADVVRPNLAHIERDVAEFNRSVLRRDDAIRRCAAGEVLLLKGKARPGNRSGGAVHRSPPIEAQGLRRLLLKIDEHPCGC